MVIALEILGLLIALIGLAGCIVPFIPGPPLSFFALIILSYAKGWEPFSAAFLIVMACLALLVELADYVVPASGAKKYGASRYGVWGSIIGMFIGLFFLPPWGMLFGGILGALAGELISGKKSSHALRASWGALLGTVLVIGLKLTLSGVILFFYVKELL